MATQFTFPRNPKIGDRIEIVSTSEIKMPINIVGNPEAGKPLTLVFPENTYTGEADGITTIHSITEINIVYGFRCVSIQNSHIWILENTCLKTLIEQLQTSISDIESRLTALETPTETISA